MDGHGDEIERLAGVYRGYRESAAVQARWSQTNPGNRAILLERDQAIRAMLDRFAFLPLSGREVLDLGCGSGQALAHLQGLGALPEHLHGVDLLPERIAEARARYPDLDFICQNAEALPFPDERFDLVLAFTVFSSIREAAMAHTVAAEAARVVKPSGAILWYDLRVNNPRSRHVHGIAKTAVARLFPAFDLHTRSITVLPPLARRLGPATGLLYPALAHIPALRTHLLAVLTKPLPDAKAVA